MKSAVEDPSSQVETTQSLDKRLSTCESSSLSSPAWTSTPTPPELVPSPLSVPSVNTSMQAADERQQKWLERMEDHRDWHFEMILEDAREARQH